MSYKPCRSHLFSAVVPLIAMLIALTGEASGQVPFMPVVDYGSGGYGATSVAVADLNGDGKPDLIVTNNCTDGYCDGTGSVGVLLGNGDGTFGTVVTYSTGGNHASAVAVADVNGDGKPDLIVTNYCTAPCQSGSVGVLLGNGNGTFQAAVLYDSGAYGSASATVADVNGDGMPDLIVTNHGINSGVIGVLLGNGDGTFQSVVTYSSGPELGSSVAVADVNGDGRPDVLLGSLCHSQHDNCEDLVGVMLGNGDGTFQPVVTYSSAQGGEYSASIAVADVNGDGKPDLLAANLDSGTVGVLLGNGDGTFRPVVTYDAGGYYTIAVTAADVNGDGKPDLILASQTIASDGSIGVLLGNGDGTFQPLANYSLGGSYPYPDWVVVADVNGDKKPDVLAAKGNTSSVGVLLNNSGAPHTTTSLASSVNPAAFNQMVTYTATVTIPSGKVLKGTVMFSDGISPIATVALVNNQSAYSTSYKAVASHSITATYSGELHNAAGSTSPALTEYIRGASKTVVSTSGSPSLVGQPVQFATTVTSRYGAIPDGDVVTFFDGNTALASVKLAGGSAAYTTSSLSGKTHTIKATYAGDTTFQPSTGAITQVVELYSTTTALVARPNPSTYGQAVSLVATVKSAGPLTPTGKVAFKDGAITIGLATLSNGVATLSASKLAAGTDSITAGYGGDGASAKSTSPAFGQVVKKASTKSTITSSKNPSVQGQNVTFTAKVTSSSGAIAQGTVVFTAGSTVLGTVTLNAGGAHITTSALPTGSDIIKVTYGGGIDFSGSSASLTQTVQ